jgi:hypothetical protein
MLIVNHKNVQIFETKVLSNKRRESRGHCSIDHRRLTPVRVKKVPI